MAEPQGPARDGGDVPYRRRRSSMTPRQRRKARRAASRRSGDAPPPTTRRRSQPEGAPGGGGGRRRTHPSRKAVQRRQRRRRRTLATAVVTVLAVAGAAVALVLSGVYDQARELVAGGADDPDEAGVIPIEERQPSAVIVTYDEDAPSADASRMLVLATDRETGRSTVLLVPTATVVDVPGRGSFELGEAHALGGGELASVSLENLLGTRFDGTVELSVQGWAALLDRVGGFTVDVRDRLVQLEEDGGQVRFEPGPQLLDGPRLAEYLTFRAQGETQLEALLRVQQVMSGLLDRIAEDEEALDRIFADGAIDLEEPALVRELLEELASARQADQLTVLTLPVAPMGGGEEAYRADTQRMEALVDEHFAASRPVGAVGAGRSLQILNGNGAPGIGEDVTLELRDGGYRVVLTGNADHFDHDTTQIIIYDDTSEQVAVAQDIQERLGVGEIVRSEVPQSVVDVTIVVGHDFLE